MNKQFLFDIKDYIDSRMTELDFKFYLIRVKSLGENNKINGQIINSNTLIDGITPVYSKANYVEGTFTKPEIGDVMMCLKLHGSFFALGSLPEEYNPNKIGLERFALTDEKIYYKISDGTIVFEIIDGIKITLSGDKLIVNKEIHAGDYYSADETKGETQTVTVGDGAGGTKQLVFKSGLFTGVI